MRFNNSIWRFFASVQLALFVFIALASTSIIGTIIPQNRHLAFYSESYGNFIAQFIFVLDIQNMYSSWWFTGLLILLSVNLIICSIDRLPLTQAKVKAKNFSFSKEKLSTLEFSETFSLSKKQQQLAIDSVKKLGWNLQTDSSRHFAEKFAWSHYGVYLVHISILTIFAGGLLGSLYGFKGSVMIPETLSSEQIYSQKNSEPYPLGFEVRCDEFDMEYYDTGMVKTYRSRLTILEDKKVVLTQDIEVNHPLTYKGVTFYQASYEGFQSFIISIIEKESGDSKVFTADYQKQVDWEEKGVKVGILNAKSANQHVKQVKFWLFDGENDPVTNWLNNEEASVISSGGKEYEVLVKQMFATGLQATKDPGVWLVYLGCSLLLIGLFICFFLSHKKIWLIQDGNKLFLAGTCNKNKPGFEKDFAQVSDTLKQLS